LARVCSSGINVNSANAINQENADTQHRDMGRKGDRIAEEFQGIVLRYIETHYGVEV
jgi:hypothetical protein